jgi:hypothetical protein
MFLSTICVKNQYAPTNYVHPEPVTNHCCPAIVSILGTSKMVLYHQNRIIAVWFCRETGCPGCWSRRFNWENWWKESPPNVEKKVFVFLFYCK